MEATTRATIVVVQSHLTLLPITSSSTSAGPGNDGQPPDYREKEGESNDLVQQRSVALTVGLKYNASCWDTDVETCPTSVDPGGENVAINLHKVQARLESERKRLVVELDGMQADAQQADAGRDGSPFGKREEEATESFEFEKRLALEKQVSANLAEVEHALDKFKKGTYGLCDVCGQPIPPERLEAVPHANVCLTCKAKYAKTRHPMG
jgi:DnaK suppressor protein